MDYILECLQILYWAFFKPFSLTQKLRDIHPDLSAFSNPFEFRQNFATNPKLKRYANQVWLLSAIAPLLITAIVAPLYTLLSRETFDWIDPGLFFLGCWIGLFFARGDNQVFSKWALRFMYIVTAIGLAFALSRNFAPQLIQPIIEAFQNQPSYSTIFNILGLVAFGVAVGVAVGVAGGVAFGVAVGVAGGVAFAISYFLGLFRIYFWLPQVVWMLGLNLLAERAEKFLKFLPPNFDEVTRLPLPFFDAFLIEAYDQNPNATRERLAYFSGYTLRQPEVNRAIVGITAQTLQRSDRITDLINFRQNLGWIGDPPRAILDLLPELRDISQDLIAASDASTPYRRLELLKPPIAKLQQLQANLKNLPSAIATQFAPGLDNWRSILHDTQTTWHNDAKRTGEIPAAYIAGNSLDPTQAAGRFKGRQDIFNEIEAIALSDSPPALLLYGGRRTGKTSTLKYLPDRVGSDLIPLRVNAQQFAETATLYGIARSFHDQIIEAAHTARNLTLPSLDPDDLKLDPLAELRRWFDAIGQQHRSKKLLLCIDEFERFDEFILSAQTHAPLHFLRNTMQRSDNWSILFSGSHTPDELAPYWSDYLIETQAIQISYLRDPEARDLIVNPTPDFPRDVYRPDAIDAIVQLTHRQPYYIQLICGELVTLLNDIRLGRGQHTNAANPDAVVTPALVKAAIPLALDRGQQYFREFWNRSLGLPERQVLTDILNGVEMPSNRPIRKKLVNKEIIQMTGDGFKFRVPLIEIYCKHVVQTDHETL